MFIKYVSDKSEYKEVTMEQEYIINACSGHAIDVVKEQTITVIDMEKKPGRLFTL